MSTNEHKLGLPIEYQQMPEYFDAHNINEQTEAKNALIKRLLKEQNVQTVLDMTCGTGSQVFYLSNHGFAIIGSDFSPALLDIARAKAKGMDRNITFIDGDMRTVKIGKFDAIITIFNAIGHVTKADFAKTLRNIKANLKDNGIYVFDILNLQSITAEVMDDFKMDIESTVKGERIHNVQHSELDKENGLLISHDQYTIYKEGHKPEAHTNSFSLQLYTVEELRTILDQNGFEIVAQYDMDGNNFIAEKSLSILTVAKLKKVG